MKTFTLKLLVLFGLILSAKQSTAQNILTDGEFNSTTSIIPLGAPPVPLNTWCSWHDLATVTSFTTDVTGGICSFNFFNSGNNTWDVQLNQYGFPLVQGNHYRLTFDVRSDANRNFGVYIGEEGGLWTNLNAANYMQQSATFWQTKTIEFNATAVFALHKLGFEMGAENITMYFDNIVLENMGPAVFQKIEIIGTSVPPNDWSAGVEMQTIDGINYSLASYPVSKGEVKFRYYQDWGVNWGANSFPWGTGILNEPNIPVMEGTYDISFNRNTGQYKFTCPVCPPAIGIIGSAVPPYDWTTDVKMITTDGINYSMNNYILNSGEVRFRQNDDWSTNWGGNTFPSGVGDIVSPNIIVTQGVYNISFNRETGAYNFQLNIPAIGILGSSLIGWNDDIDLQSNDGINYTLQNYPFNAGEVKFRQDNDWSINWGNTDFPNGTGFPGGPNIPVPAGNYDVYFNRSTGWYSFSLICPDPVLQCIPDTVVNAAAGSCGAIVVYSMPAPADNCGYPYVYQYGGLPSGSFFPVGTITNSFVVVNSTGKTAYCSFNVTVKDMEPPVISQVSADPSELWPPNNKMKNVSINYTAWDNCGEVSSSLSVKRNEAIRGAACGDHERDWVVLDDHHLLLRAERSDHRNGRVYTITITSKDLSGNTSKQTTNVAVPHHLSNNHDCNGLVSKSGDCTNDNGDYYDQGLACKITPNPTTNYFNVEVMSSSNETILVKLSDISGRMFSTLNTVKNQTLRVGEDLRPGLYIIEVIQGNQRKIMKVLKQ